MSEYFEVITDAQTGEQTIRLYTKEEIAAIQAIPKPVPPQITRRQCARQLYAIGMITGPEAVAMTRNGTPPAMVQTYLAALPEAARYVAEMDFAADTYLRNNPLLAALMAANDKTDAEVDQFFIDAEAL